MKQEIKGYEIIILFAIMMSVLFGVSISSMIKIYNPLNQFLTLLFLEHKISHGLIISLTTLSITLFINLVFKNRELIYNKHVIRPIDKIPFYLSKEIILNLPATVTISYLLYFITSKFINIFLITTVVTFTLRLSIFMMEEIWLTSEDSTK